MDKISSNESLSANVMEEIYVFEKKNILKTLIVRLFAMITSVAILIYLIFLGVKILMDEGETMVMELIWSDISLVKQYFASEFIYLFNIFDEKLFLAILTLSIFMTFLLIITLKKRKILQNKWWALKRIRSKLN